MSPLTVKWSLGGSWLRSTGMDPNSLAKCYLFFQKKKTNNCLECLVSGIVSRALQMDSVS